MILSNGDKAWEAGSKPLTKREYFAAIAMQGILSAGKILEESFSVWKKGLTFKLTEQWKIKDYLEN